MGHEIPYRFIRNAVSDPQNRLCLCAAYLYSAALGVVVGLKESRLLGAGLEEQGLRICTILDTCFENSYSTHSGELGFSRCAGVLKVAP